MIRGLSLNLLLGRELLAQFRLNLCLFGVVHIFRLVPDGASRILLTVRVANKRPAVNLFVVCRIHFIVVLKNILLLILSTHDIFELFLVLLERVSGFGHLNLFVGNFVPVDRVEEGVPLDLVGSILAGTKSFAGIAVEQMHNQVLSFI